MVKWDMEHNFSIRWKFARKICLVLLFLNVIVVASSAETWGKKNKLVKLQVMGPKWSILDLVKTGPLRKSVLEQG